jgi:hypothetical protein
MFGIAVNQNVALLWVSNLKESSCNKKEQLINTNKQKKKGYPTNDDFQLPINIYKVRM